MAFVHAESMPANLALEAEYAGSALACTFSSSDEFEAALIQGRRNAGAYGPTARQRRLFWGGVMFGALVALSIVIV